MDLLFFLFDQAKNSNCKKLKINDIILNGV